MSVKSHLTYGASVRPENAVTYSAGNKGQNICGIFSETAPLQRSSTPSIVRPCVQSAIFPAESTHAHYSIYHVVDRSCPVRWCREDGCEFRELPLIMPPSKVCNAVLPIRLKVCKSCQHVFRAKRQIEHTLPHTRRLPALRWRFLVYLGGSPLYTRYLPVPPTQLPKQCTEGLHFSAL